MPLHPDKIVSLANIAAGGSIPNREPVKSSTLEQRAINAAKTRRSKALPDKKPGEIDLLAYDLRDSHWANHLTRFKKHVGPATGEKKPKQPQQPSLVINLPGGGTNG